MLRSSPYGLTSRSPYFPRIQCTLRYPIRPRSFHLSSKSFSANTVNDTQPLSRKRASRPWIYPTTLFLVGIGGLASYHYSDEFRHSVLAMVGGTFFASHSAPNEKSRVSRFAPHELLEPQYWVY